MLLSVVSSAFLGSALLGDTDVSLDTNARAKANANVVSDIKVRADETIKVREREKIHTLTEIRAEVEEDEDTESDDITVTLDEIDASVSSDARTSAFTQLHRGVGWVTSNDSGKMAALFWIEKTFVINSEEEIRAGGQLKVDSKEKYRLTLDSKTEDQIVFDVRNPRTNTEGTLTLDAKTSLPGFTVWEGTLLMKDGMEYDISIATKDSRIRGNLNSELNTTGLETVLVDKVNVDANINVSTELREKLAELKQSIENSSEEIKVEIKVEKEDEGNATAEVEVEGDLSDEQKALVEDIKQEAVSLVDSSTKSDAKIEIEVESESKVKGNGNKIGFWNRLRLLFRAKQ